MPVHILSRDPKLIEEFLEQGFSAGLVLPASGGARAAHAGLFSLIVRALVRYSGSGDPLPAYLRSGVSLGG